MQSVTTCLTYPSVAQADHTIQHCTWHSCIYIEILKAIQPYISRAHVLRPVRPRPKCLLEAYRHICMHVCTHGHINMFRGIEMKGL